MDCTSCDSDIFEEGCVTKMLLDSNPNNSSRCGTPAPDSASNTVTGSNLSFRFGDNPARGALGDITFDELDPWLDRNIYESTTHDDEVSPSSRDIPESSSSDIDTPGSTSWPPYGLPEGFYINAINTAPLNSSDTVSATAETSESNSPLQLRDGFDDEKDSDIDFEDDYDEDDSDESVGHSDDEVSSSSRDFADSRAISPVDGPSWLYESTLRINTPFLNNTASDYNVDDSTGSNPEYDDSDSDESAVHIDDEVSSSSRDLTDSRAISPVDGPSWLYESTLRINTPFLNNTTSDYDVDDSTGNNAEYDNSDSDESRIHSDDEVSPSSADFTGSVSLVDGPSWLYESSLHINTPFTATHSNNTFSDYDSDVHDVHDSPYNPFESSPPEISGPIYPDYYTLPNDFFDGATNDTDYDKPIRTLPPAQYAGPGLTCVGCGSIFQEAPDSNREILLRCPSCEAKLVASCDYS